VLLVNLALDLMAKLVQGVQLDARHALLTQLAPLACRISSYLILRVNNATALLDLIISQLMTAMSAELVSFSQRAIALNVLSQIVMYVVLQPFA
jgi:hypothetical protein